MLLRKYVKANAHYKLIVEIHGLPHGGLRVLTMRTSKFRGRGDI